MLSGARLDAEGPVESGTEVLQGNGGSQFHHLLRGEVRRQSLEQSLGNPGRGGAHRLGVGQDVLLQLGETVAFPVISQGGDLFRGDSRLTGETIGQVDSEGAFDLSRRPVHGQPLQPLGKFSGGANRFGQAEEGAQDLRPPAVDSQGGWNAPRPPPHDPEKKALPKGALTISNSLHAHGAIPFNGRAKPRPDRDLAQLFCHSFDLAAVRMVVSTGSAELLAHSIQEPS